LSFRRSANRRLHRGTGRSEHTQSICQLPDRGRAVNFDTIRNMLADDVRVEPVGLTRMNGRSAMAKYFRSSLVQDRDLVAGFVDRRPAGSGARSERYGNVEFDIAGIPPAAEAGTVRRTECRMGYENTEMTNTSMKGNDVNNMYYYALFYDVVDDF